MFGDCTQNFAENSARARSLLRSRSLEPEGLQSRSTFVEFMAASGDAAGSSESQDKIVASKLNQPGRAFEGKIILAERERRRAEKNVVGAGLPTDADCVAVGERRNLRRVLGLQSWKENGGDAVAARELGD